MSCVVRDACTFRDDAQTGMDLLRVEQPQLQRQTPGKGDLRQFRTEAESLGASPSSSRSALPVGLEPAQMRELHSVVRELVARDLYNELEPLRVQLASQQKQLQQLQMQHFHARSEIEERSIEISEKKLADLTSPRFEAWKVLHERRLTNAEHIIREISLAQDKYTQRQDTLMQSFDELDEKIDKMASSKVPLHMQLDRHAPPASMGDAGFGLHTGLSPAPETFGRAVESALPKTASSVFTKSGVEVEEFTFDVDKSSGSLGLILKNDGDMLLIEKISSGCVLPVNIGDRVVAVNGVRDDNKAMLEELRRNFRLSLTCERELITTV